MKYEWTELTYQKILAGNTMVYIFHFLFPRVPVLAAQYESCRTLVIILIVSDDFVFRHRRGLAAECDNNVFTQISFDRARRAGLQDAILIVNLQEKQLHEGMNRVDAGAGSVPAALCGRS